MATTETNIDHDSRDMQVDNMPAVTKDTLPTATIGSRGVQLTNLSEMMRFSQMVIQSGLAPKECKSTSNAMIRIQMGLEVGLSPMQAIQSICVINGSPSMWGAAIKGLVYRSGLCEQWDGQYIGTPYDDDYRYECCVKRKGMLNPQTYSFSVADAKKAGLWGKNTWANFPKDMLMHRANGRAAKDQFPDVLKGLEVAEVAQDYIDVPYSVDEPKEPSPFAQHLQAKGIIEGPQGDAPENSEPAGAIEPEEKPQSFGGGSLRELRAHAQKAYDASGISTAKWRKLCEQLLGVESGGNAYEDIAKMSAEQCNVAVGALANE